MAGRRRGVGPQRGPRRRRRRLQPRPTVLTAARPRCASTLHCWRRCSALGLPRAMSSPVGAGALFTGRARPVVAGVPGVWGRRELARRLCRPFPRPAAARLLTRRVVPQLCLPVGGGPMGTGAAGRSALMGCLLQGIGRQEADAALGAGMGFLQAMQDAVAQLGMQVNALTKLAELYAAVYRDCADRARLPALGALAHARTPCPLPRDLSLYAFSLCRACGDDAPCCSLCRCGRGWGSLH